MSRLLSIDFLRGFVVLLMTIDHTRYFFSTVEILTPMGTDLPPSYFFIRWFTHFCAPTFAFLAGLSIALRPGDDSALQLTVIKRGLFLLIPTVLTSVVWNSLSADPGFTLFMSELWAIGGGMVFVGLMMRFKLWVISVISLVFITGHHLCEAWDNSDSILWFILHVPTNLELVKNSFRIHFNDPLLPWLGVVGLGYVMGCYFFRENAIFVKNRKVMLQLIGFACLILFMLLRYTNAYGDPHLFVVSASSFITTLCSFIDVTKNPLSLLFVLLTLPFACFVLSFSDSKFFNMPSRGVTVVSQYGQAALFYYVIHMFVILSYSALIGHKSTSLGLTFLMTAVVIVTMYPLVRLFTRFRHRNKDKYPILVYL